MKTKHQQDAKPKNKAKEHMIEELMFVSDVTSPHFVDNKVCVFDGKIGIWPPSDSPNDFHLSTSRDNGNKIPSSYQADIWWHDREQCLIREKWPDDNKWIHLQHDNASTHFGSDCAPFVAAASAEGWDIQLTKQPANSPDLIINDLSFFRALQSGQWESVEESNNDFDSLIEAVQEAFNSFDPKLLNYSLLTLQGCMEEIILVNDNNNYDILHMGNAALDLVGLLPDMISAGGGSIELARTFLDEEF